jgi:hypothetical protein
MSSNAGGCPVAFVGSGGGAEVKFHVVLALLELGNTAGSSSQLCSSLKVPLPLGIPK